MESISAFPPRESRWSRFQYGVGCLGDVTSFNRCVVIVRPVSTVTSSEPPNAKNTATRKDVNMERAEAIAAFLVSGVFASLTAQVKPISAGQTQKFLRDNSTA